MKTIYSLLLTLWLAPLQAGPDILTICTNYHCENTKEVTLRDIEWGQVLKPFEKKASDAQQERQHISRSIALFEQVVGLHTGTHADMAKNLGEDQIGQLGCISESRNTTQYLESLNKKNKLKWHRVKERISRSTFIFDIHWTAVIQDKQSGEQYTVDSWFYKNGEAPIIQLLEQWKKKRPASNTFVP